MHEVPSGFIDFSKMIQYLQILYKKQVEVLPQSRILEKRHSLVSTL